MCVHLDYEYLGKCLNIRMQFRVRQTGWSYNSGFDEQTEMIAIQFLLEAERNRYLKINYFLWNSQIKKYSPIPFEKLGNCIKFSSSCTFLMQFHFQKNL